MSIFMNMQAQYCKVNRIRDNWVERPPFTGQVQQTGHLEPTIVVNKDQQTLGLNQKCSVHKTKKALNYFPHWPLYIW